MIRRFDVDIALGTDTVGLGAIEVDEREGRTLRVDVTYRTDYLARDEKVFLDPATPLAVARHVGASLPRGIADAGPDGWGRRLVLRTRRGAVSDTDLLLAVDDFARIGALRFRDEPAGEHLARGHTVPPLVELADLAEAAGAVEDDPDDLAAVRRLVGAGSASLGGARPKASVRDGDRLAIAKFASGRDEIEAEAWEKLCLDLAGAAGIAVPASRLVEVGRSRALLLERFDRRAEQRVPYLSAFAITGAPDAASGDYLHIAEALAELDTADLPGTLRELWRRVAFSVAMRNTDDHLKNHAFLWSRAGWRLSPAFDITPDPVGGTTRATSINGEDLPGREPGALVALAAGFGIPPKEQRAILGEVLAAASCWREGAARLGIAEGEIRRLGQVLDEAQGRLDDVARR